MKPIAIIGIGCRFPGSKGADSYLKLLQEGKDATGPIPPERLKLSRLLENLSATELKKLRGGYLTDIDRFDADFFHISPREAVYIDPQQRFLLEVAWEALENAGLAPSRLRGSRTGVFVGISTNDYSLRTQIAHRIATAYSGTGSALSIAANRLSYQLDLHGPSVAVDTACSSSLVALHLACASIDRGESEVALAAGVNIILSPMPNLIFDQANVISPTGSCKTFDSKADGIVRSEGVGAIVLKPLDQAIRDGDSIYAVVCGTAVNQDGRTNGLMAPNRWAQEKVIRQALAEASLKPSDVDYVEAHGTGTLLGDPIEASALGAIFSEGRPGDRPLRIGSVKPNIGHTEAAAGIAGVIKVALSMKAGVLPRSIHFDEPNPYIQFEKLRLAVQDRNTPWNLPGEAPAVAGVSSFGFGGTNAHALLKGYHRPPTRALSSLQRPRILAISAASLPALKKNAEAYSAYFDHFAERSSVSVEEACQAAAHGRDHFPHRLSVIGRVPADFARALKDFANEPGFVPPKSSSKTIPGPVFVFSGHGSQWEGMARELLKENSAFSKKMSECDQAIRSEAGWSVLDELSKREGLSGTGIDRVQPTLFSIAVSLAEMWKGFGIAPSAVIGHSMGEVAAAHVAEILSLPDAVKIICTRSQLLTSIRNRGAMAVLERTLDDSEALIESYADRVSIAASNGPKSTVIAGDPSAVSEIVEGLASKGLFAKLVQVEVASHCAQVDPILGDLEKALSSISPLDGKVSFYSTVQSARIAGSGLQARYWLSNLRRPVFFQQTIAKMVSEGYRTFIEVSPHPLLVSSVEEVASGTGEKVRALPTLRRGEPEQECVLRTAGALYESGCALDWGAIYPEKRNLPNLPNYQWQGQSFWLDDHAAALESLQDKMALAGSEIVTAGARDKRAWQVSLSKHDLSYVNDHRIQGTALFPGTGYVELAFRAAAEVFPGKEVHLQNLRMHRALVLNSDSEQKLQTVLSGIHQNGADFKVFSNATYRRKDSKGKIFWLPQASGFIHARPSPSAERANVPSLQELEAKFRDTQPFEDFYPRLATFGIQYLESFRVLKDFRARASEALAEIQPPPGPQAEAGNYLLHPALLDGSLHTLMGLVHFGIGIADQKEPYWPVAVDEIRVLRPFVAPKWSYARLAARSPSSSSFRGDVFIYDDQGSPLIELLGIHFEKANGDADANPQGWPLRRTDWLYQLRWVPANALARKPLPDFGSWLLLCDQGGVGNRVGTELEKAGKTVRRIRPDESFSAYSEALAQAVRDGGDKGVGIIHFSALDARGNDEMKAGRRAAQSLLALYRALDGLKLEQIARVWTITSAAQWVEGETPKLNPFQAPMHGICRTLSVEQPLRFGGLIDLDHPIDPTAAAQDILRELGAPDKETQVALRKSVRFAPRILRKPSDDFPIPFRVRPDRTYVVTGGLGNLGKLAVEGLIRTGARKILVLGRTAVPPRSQWKDAKLREHPGVQTLLKLEREGCDVQYVQVDVSDLGALEKAINGFRDFQFPPIAGVIHAAGLVFAKTFCETKPEELDSVMRPKVEGTWNLQQVLEREGPLDFFVAYSSFSVWMNSPYLGAYAGANAFMDSWMHHRRAQGKTGQVVNWATWQGEDDSPSQQGSFKGVGVIRRDAGMGLLEQFLATGVAQVGVAVVNWKSLKSQYPDLADSPVLKELMSDFDIKSQKAPDKDGQSDQLGSLLQLEGSARRPAIESFLVSTVAKAVRRQAREIDPTAPLNTFGLDSLIALEIKNAIARATQMVIPVPYLLKGPTVVELAKLIEESMSRAGNANATQQSPENKQVGFTVEDLTESEIDQVLKLLGGTGESGDKAA